MDFYTLKTTVDIVELKEAFRVVLSTIGFFSQPLIIGEPVAEEASYVFRYAVREDTMRVFENDVVVNLSKTEHGFTKENTQLIRAARI